MTERSEETRDIKESLLMIRDTIHALAPGPDRDKFQGRLDRMVTRIEQVPGRVMAAFDDRGLRGAELAAAWRVEMLWAMSAWTEDA
jgi:hypothetical protein